MYSSKQQRSRNAPPEKPEVVYQPVKPEEPKKELVTETDLEDPEPYADWDF